MIKTQEDFLRRMGEIYAEQLETARRKNTDYGGSRDPFANFKLSEGLGISMIDAVIVRMSDKLSRIATLKDKDPLVKGESIIDTLSDLSVYSVILRMIFENLMQPEVQLSDAPKLERSPTDVQRGERPLEEDDTYDLGLK